MDIQTILARKGSTVHIIGPDATIGEAVQRLVTTGVSALVVSDDGVSLTGIMSDRGVIRALAEGGGAVLNAPLRTIMTTEVITCRPTDTVNSVMATMSTRRIRHIPVTDEDSGVLLGLVSIGDVVQNRITEMSEETTAMRDYIGAARC